MANPQQSISHQTPGRSSPEVAALRRFIDFRFAELDRKLSLLFIGKGTPAAVVDAPRGSLYLRTDGGAGTTFYVNETGGVGGWAAK